MKSNNCRVGKSHPRAAGHMTEGQRRQAVTRPMAAAFHRSGAGDVGTMRNWNPRVVSGATEARERERIMHRTNDQYLNNPIAASAVETSAISTVGSGLKPRSLPDVKQLKKIGFDEDMLRDIADQANREYLIFNRGFDAETSPSIINCQRDGNFVQLENMYSMLVNGEFCNLPVWIDDDPNRKYYSCMQTLEPIRLRSPFGAESTRNLKDGIRYGTRNQPTGYLIANPSDGRFTPTLGMAGYTEYPAMVGHRPGFIHRFIKKLPGQKRGRSILETGLKSGKDLDDLFDFELVAHIMAANFPVFIEKTSGQTPGHGLYNVQGTDGQDLENNYYSEMMPGATMYGNLNEKPHILASRQTDGNFDTFTNTYLSLAGAPAGLSKEHILKDFSQTNFSSWRAAMMEAYKVFCMYQDWFIGGSLNVNWNMFFEEAFLRGFIDTGLDPQNNNDLNLFYANFAAFTRVGWTKPKRGSIDPVKSANAFKILRNLPGMPGATYADHFEDEGMSVDEAFAQIEREDEQIVVRNDKLADDVGVVAGAGGGGNQS